MPTDLKHKTITEMIMAWTPYSRPLRELNGALFTGPDHDVESIFWVLISGPCLSEPHGTFSELEFPLEQESTRLY